MPPVVGRQADGGGTSTSYHPPQMYAVDSHSNKGGGLAAGGVRGSVERQLSRQGSRTNTYNSGGQQQLSNTARRGEVAAHSSYDAGYGNAQRSSVQRMPSTSHNHGPMSLNMPSRPPSSHYGGLHSPRLHQGNHKEPGYGSHSYMQQHGGSHPQMASQAQRSGLVSRGNVAAPQGRGPERLPSRAGPPPGSSGRDAYSIQVTITQNDPGWKNMPGETGTHAGHHGHADPPSAGMRGAMSWGIGPNVYEVDGRPGTRGGGPSYDMEGRPTTRGAQRPPSRAQLGMAGRGPAGGGGNQGQGVSATTGSWGSALLMQTGALTQPPPYVGAGSSSSMSASADFGRSSLTRSSIPAAMSGSSASLNSSASGALSSMPTGNTARRGALALSNTGRLPPLQSISEVPGGLANTHTAHHAPDHDAERRGGGGHHNHNQLHLGGRSDAASCNSQQMTQSGRLADMDSFLEALSEEDDDAANLDDLSNYLNAIDQDDAKEKDRDRSGRRRSARSSSGRQASGRRSARSATKSNSSNDGGSRQRSASSQAPNSPDKKPPANSKAVKVAHAIVDKLVEMAVRTSTVEAVIREAEARERALAAETAAITLDGADWQAQVAASLSGSIQADSMSSFAAKGPSFTKQKQGDAQVLSLELPADDFKGLNAAGQRLPRDMVQQQPRGPGPAHRVPGPAPGLLMPDRPPTSEHAPGMSRYGAHRVR